MNRTQLEAAAALGCRIQIWHLRPGATSSADGQWDTYVSRPKFGCPIHLYRVHPDDEHLLHKHASEEFVLVPKRIYVSPDAWEAAQFAFGGPGSSEDEPFYDCTLWVGEIENDDGTKTYGLHVSCDECPEEGSITLSDFPATPPVTQSEILDLLNECPFDVNE